MGGAGQGPREGDRLSMDWLHKLRLRAFAVVLGSVLGAVAIVGWLSVPVLPALGVALITAAALVNTMASRLSVPTCAGCAKDLSKLHAGTYGVICPDCGTINQHFDEVRLAKARGEGSGKA
jgi:phage FluMu protein Com